MIGFWRQVTLVGHNRAKNKETGTEVELKTKRNFTSYVPSNGIKDKDREGEDQEGI